MVYNLLRPVIDLKGRVIMAKKKKKGVGLQSSGKYRRQVVVGYTPEGKRIVKSFMAKTEWEAIKMADDFRARHGIGCDPDELTVAAALEKYINARRDIIAPSTLNGYNIILKNRLQSIMLVKISELKILDVQAAVNADFRDKGSSRKTLRSALSLINSALTAQGYNYDLCKRVTIPAPKAKREELPEASQVIALIKGTEFELPCMLAMWLSLRVSEVRGLKYSDISKDGTRLTICRTRVYLGIEHDEKRDYTKNEGSNRTVRLPKYLYELIMSQPHDSDDDYIVDMSYNQVSQNFRRYMKKNGIKMTFHQLRHLFASSANDLGVADEYIQKIGGWASNNILKSVYTHTSSSLEMKYQKLIDDYYMELLEKNG